MAGKNPEGHWAVFQGRATYSRSGKTVGQIPHIYTTCNLKHKQRDIILASELPALSVTSEENGHHVNVVCRIKW